MFNQTVAPDGADAAAGSNSDASGFSMDDLFSTRKPRDFRAGVASGLKSFGKGIITGAAGLVAAPIIGAREEGFAGAAKGLGAGIVGAVVLPVAGLGVGTVQGAHLATGDQSKRLLVWCDQP